MAQANVTAQEAQLGVLRQQKIYQSVVAPFDGIITQRNINIGTWSRPTRSAAPSCSRSCRAT